MIEELFKPVLETAQQELNKLHDENGATDEILEDQIKLNRIRHILNVSDETNRLHERFVQ